MSTKLIGISGKIGSGKDSVAKMLQIHSINQGSETFLCKEDVVKLWNDEIFLHSLDNASPLPIKRFAAILKQFVANLINVDVSLLDNQDFKKTDLPIEWAKYKTPEDFYKTQMTVREIMIAIGDGMRNAVHPDIWVNALFSAYEGEKWLIPDVRYPNEMNRINKLCGTVIRVERPGIQTLDHISEKALDGADFVHTIINDGSLEDLFDKTKLVYDRISL